MDKVMLVTKDVALPRRIRGAVEDLGLEGIQVAESVEEARKLLGESAWDVVIVDLQTIAPEHVPTLRLVSLDVIPPGILALATEGGDAAALEALGHLIQGLLPRAMPQPAALVRTVSILASRRRTVQRTVDAVMNIKMHAAAITAVPSLQPAIRTHSAAIVDEVEKLRDAITAEYGRGLRPPTESALAAASAARAGAAAAAGGAPAKAKILIVDDSKMTLAVVRSRMESAGFQVVTSSDSKGCGLLALKERPDMILLDVMMPGIRGDLQAQLISGDRELRKASILLLHSDLPEESLKEMVFRSGADGYIHKNAEPAAFVAEIEDWLAELKNRRATQG